MVDGEIERYWPRFMAEPGGISHLAIFDSTRSCLMPLHRLDAGLTGHKQQGISVSQGVVRENGSVLKVMRFLLTAEQIVEPPARTNGRERDKGARKEHQTGLLKTPTRAGAWPNTGACSHPLAQALNI
jgi:hypothetical protein